MADARSPCQAVGAYYLVSTIYTDTITNSTISMKTSISARRITKLLFVSLALPLASHAQVIISSPNSPFIINFESDIPGVFAVGSGNHANFYGSGGALTNNGHNAVLAEPDSPILTNSDRVGVLNSAAWSLKGPNRNFRGAGSTGANIGSGSNLASYFGNVNRDVDGGDTDTVDYFGLAVSATGATTLGDPATPHDNSTRPLGFMPAGALMRTQGGGAMVPSNSLIIERGNATNTHGIYLRIQNNTGMTISEWNFAFDVLYADNNGTFSSISFAYAVSNTDDVETLVDQWTTFGGNPVLSNNGGTVFSPAGGGDNGRFGGIVNASVNDGDFIILAFNKTGQGSDVLIDNISITGVVPEPSVYAAFCGLGALLIAWVRRRIQR